jgi:putative transposase
MVKELAGQQGIALVCQTVGVSRSGYYAWDERPQSQRTRHDMQLAEKIEGYWQASRKTYGRVRLTRKLRSDGEMVGKNRVRKIMKIRGIAGAGRKKFKPMTTTPDPKLPVAERVFKTEFAAQQAVAPNRFWGGDITYIPTGEGWLYLAVVLDLCTRKVVGHAMRDTLQAELVEAALEMAIGRQGITKAHPLVSHTDRGSQYAAGTYTARLKDFNITASMSRKGNCYDNAFVESFFRTLKVELIYTKTFATRKEAVAAIFEYIEVWYNRERLHSSLDYATPEQYEAKHFVA